MLNFGGVTDTIFHMMLFGLQKALFGCVKLNMDKRGMPRAGLQSSVVNMATDFVSISVVPVSVPAHQVTSNEFRQNGFWMLTVHQFFDYSPSPLSAMTSVAFVSLPQ